MFSVTMTSKSRRAADEVHRAGVDEHVLERDVGELRRRPRASRPRATGATSPARSPCRRSMSFLRRPRAMRGRGAHDPLDLGHGVRRRGRSARSSSRVFVAEVDAAGQLAHDHHVHAREQLGLAAARRAAAGVHASPGAGWRRGPAPCGSPAAPAPGRTLARGSSHFGPPTAPSSTASARPGQPASVSGGQRACRWRRWPRRRSAPPAKRTCAPSGRHRRQHPQRFTHHLRANSVAWQNRNCSTHGLRFPPF